MSANGLCFINNYSTDLCQWWPILWFNMHTHVYLVEGCFKGGLSDVRKKKNFQNIMDWWHHHRRAFFAQISCGTKVS